MEDKSTRYLSIFIICLLFVEYIIYDFKSLNSDYNLIFLLLYVFFVNIRTYQVQNLKYKEYSLVIDFIFFIFMLVYKLEKFYILIISLIFQLYRYLEIKLALIINSFVYLILVSMRLEVINNLDIYIIFYLIVNVFILAYFYINNKFIVLEAEKKVVEGRYNDLVLKTQELKKNQLDLLGASKTEERNRIARDLHDSVGHLLSTLSIQLTALEKITKSRDLSISENIGELKDFTQDGLREVRKIIHDMKVENKNNWKNNIEKLINNSGIEVNYIVNEETWTLNERQEQAIYRIIQEFITNSQKYADTNKINISLIFSQDSLVLSMKDFGKGCDNFEEKGGLLSIRERVNELHGEMNVESGNNKGFYLQVYIPRVI